jgi:hypothetical protein
MAFCDKCGSDRLLYILGKCGDLCDVSIPHIRFKMSGGGVPSGYGIGSGDYIEFEVCLHCGKIQGDFPVVGDIP